jgi:hypothetical protein
MEYVGRRNELRLYIILGDFLLMGKDALLLVYNDRGCVRKRR